MVTRKEHLCHTIIYYFFFQVSTPLELPAATVPTKQDPVVFTAPIPAAKGPDTSPRLSLAASLPIASPPQVTRASANLLPADDADAELDLLLGLDKPDPGATGSQPAETSDKHVVQEGGLILQMACKYANKILYFPPTLLFHNVLRNADPSN